MDPRAKPCATLVTFWSKVFAKNAPLPLQTVHQAQGTMPPAHQTTRVAAPVPRPQLPIGAGLLASTVAPGIASNRFREYLAFVQTQVDHMTLVFRCPLLQCLRLQLQLYKLSLH